MELASNQLKCGFCGTGHKTLKRHLRTSHDLDPAAYREMFGLKPEYSLVPPSYSEARSSLATSFGLGRKAKVLEPKPEAAPSESFKEKKGKGEDRKACTVAQQGRTDAA